LALYYASSPAPANANFSSVNDALVIRGGQFVWLIDGPGMRYTPAEIDERCRPILDLFNRPGKRWGVNPSEFVEAPCARSSELQSRLDVSLEDGFPSGDGN
jgi:hypothetical protein